eukprot:4910934-Amphidinium_carterae.1
MLQSCMQTGCNQEAAERLYRVLRTQIATEVRSQQQRIVFNSTDKSLKWINCESVEVTVKERTTGNDRANTTECLGIVRRRTPATLAP